MLPAQSTFERIALNRVTFGARDVDVRSVQRTGWAAWVEDQLSAPRGDDPQLAQYFAALRMRIKYAAYNNAPFYSWPAVDEERPLNFLHMNTQQLWAYARYVPRAAEEQSRAFHELASAVYIRNVHGRYQLREFMADFWHNHFSVFNGKDDQTKAALIVYDREIIRPHALGSFRRMVEDAGTSVSMLKYLDNADSQADQPNENYARELMELHTMGRGAYLGKHPDSNADLSAQGFTDDDIIQASRAFSGWTVAQGQPGVNGRLPDTGGFVFNPRQHHAGAGRCLGFDLSKLAAVGLEGDNLAQGRKVFDLACTHPATAPFVCTKLCRRIFGDTPPQNVIDRAVEAWTANYYKADHIAQVLRAILLDGPEVGQGPVTKIRRPHERIVALARVTEGQVKPHEIWARALNPVSDAPFGWRGPDGRPDINAFWLNPQVNVENWNQAQYLTGGNDTYFHMDIVGQTPAEALTSPTLFVEHWIGRMIGYSLSNEAMTALVKEAAQYFNIYPLSSKQLNAALAAFVIAPIATTPEFVTR